MMMQLNRDHVHVAKNGLSIGFIKDVPTHVPPRLVPDVVALGGTVSAEADQGAVDAEMKIVNEAAIVAEGRSPAIEAAIRKMVDRNQRGDFTAGGRPNLNVLAKELGFMVNADEIEAPWRKVQADIKS